MNIAGIALGILTSSISIMAATPTMAVASSLQWDVEVDPIAYALDGYSLHVGLSPNFGRLDLGLFAMRLPDEVVGNENFEASFRGAGLKWDFSPISSQGLFLGIDGGWSEQRFVHLPTDREIIRHEYGYGVRTGYRMIFSSLTVTPWLGISYNPKSDDVVVGDDILKRQKWVPFPTVHIGYMF